MNILFVGKLPFIPFLGGVERVTDLLTKLFIDEGFNVIYLVLESSDSHSNYKFQNKQYVFSKEKGNNIQDFYNEVLEIEKIDIVINQYAIFNIADFVYKAPINPNIKIISVIHNTPYLGLEHYRYFYFSTNKDVASRLKNAVKFLTYPWSMEFIKYFKISRLKNRYRFLNRKSDSLVMLSESYVKEVNKLINSEESKVISIPNINTYGFEKIPIGQKKKQILYVGRIDRGQKRVDRIVKIWRTLAASNDEWNLIIIGQGPQEQELIDYVDKYKIERVRFLGQVSNPIEYFKESSILCLTSNFEGFPMVLNESMKASCVPVVFDSFTALKDALDPVDPSLKIKAFDHNAFCCKMNELMSNPELLLELRKKCVDSSRKYDAECIKKLWIDLFDNLKK